MWRGGLGVAYRFAGPFVCQCLTSHTVLRLHIPLIEPYMRFSRIRLSDKGLRLRPREVARPLPKPHKPQNVLQIVVAVS